MKIFATGYWDEKWSRGTVTDIDTSDGYFSWLKLLSANYASDNGYMVIANNFFMFWNELLSFDTMRVGEDLRFQPSAYSLENSLAEYLLVQNDAAPMLASPYRYKQGAGHVPDNIQREKIYLTYAINFRPPDDRKPTNKEIERYSIYLKEHVSIINPKIIILMGSTAMESITGTRNKISNERGKWKEIILKSKTYPIMVTFSPSYLIRFPDFKKYSWEDLKKIRKKIKDLNITI